MIFGDKPSRSMAWFVLVFYAYLPCYLPSTYPDFFSVGR
nr:MAG TPA: hypothetical protein [Caudoviricetes sp.]